MIFFYPTPAPTEDIVEKLLLHDVLSLDSERGCNPCANDTKSQLEEEDGGKKNRQSREAALTMTFGHFRETTYDFD